MKLTVALKDLKTELSRCASLPGMNQASAVLLEADAFAGLFIQRNTIMASMRVKCDATVHVDGSAAVSFDSLRSLAGRCPGATIEFEIKKAGHIAYKSGSSTGNLAIWPATDIPRTLPPVQAEPVEFPDADQLGKWLKIAGDAAWTGEGRSNLEGACIRSINGKLTVLGCDGRRVHACIGPDTFNFVMPTAGLEYDPGILIKGDMLRSLEACLAGENCKATIRAAETCQVEVADRWVRFCYPKEAPPDMTIYMKPAKRDVRFKVDRLEFLSVLRSASGLAYGAQRMVEIHLQNGQLLVRAEDGKGNDFSDDIGATTSTQGILCVNADYMTKWLEGLGGEIIEIAYDREYHALFCEEADRWFMVMTIRSSNPKQTI